MSIRIFATYLLFTFGILSNCRSDQPNVLFIAIDDMNDWTGFLGGHPQAVTPNMDRLARRSVNFTNAHCIAPACSPCRLGLLYGAEPFHSGLYPFYDHQQIPDSVLGKYTSLPALFRQQGYQSFGAGKIFHGSVNLPGDWDEYHEKKQVNLTYAPELGYQQGDSTKMAFCPTTNPLKDHPDFQVTSYGVDVLSRKHERPFFLAVGIVKPHLAFVCPEQFFEMQAEQIEEPAIEPKDLTDVPWVGRSMVKLGDDHKFRKAEAWQRVRRSYLACISWADYNVGRLLDALDASPHARNTIVVLWSDHGYHQGEKRSFRKFSLWEESTRVPFLLMDTRQQNAPENRSSDEAVSLINIYRTLGDLCNLNVPKYVDGQSLAELLTQPDKSIDAPAITTWGRGNYTVRDDRYRYIRYFDGGEELYDHSNDPNEWKNLADDSAYATIKSQLSNQLPDKEAPLVKQGIALWNVIDADQPQKLKKFKNTTWPDWLKKLKPSLQ